MSDAIQAKADKNDRVLLLVDDDASVRVTLGLLLRRRTGAKVIEVDGSLEALDVLSRSRVDLVITDLSLGKDQSGIDVIKATRRLWPEAGCILMSGMADKSSAVGALEVGAHFFLEKPFSNEDFVAKVNNLLRGPVGDVRSRPSRRHNHKGERKAIVAVGQSSAWTRVVEQVERAAQSEATVVLEGETGTGKGVLARLIHSASSRRGGPMRSINCGALVETLLESQLFGHVRGSFTGADRDSVGLLRSAERGTFFLDEIGETTPATQVKLLRVLQEREVIPVGGVEASAIDVRFVAATNRSLTDMVNEGKFRKDLYYRLNVITIQVPSLRERREDIEGLVGDILERMRRIEGEGAAEGISDDAMGILRQYDWPGNIRELENALAYAVAMGGAVILPEALPVAIRENRKIVKTDGDIVLMENVERAYSWWALGKCGGDRVEAARLLGISLERLRSLTE